MKPHARYFKRPNRTILNIIFLTCSLWLICPLPAVGRDAVADETISLDAKGRPLAEILDDIAGTTGYQFDIHEDWDDFPISVSLKNEPLHKALKKILRGLNNAIVYGPDRTIKIKIYGEVSSSGSAVRQQIPERPSGRTNQPFGTRRNQSIRALNPRSSLQDQTVVGEEAPAEEDVGSVPETPEITDDNTEETQEGADSADEEKEQSEEGAESVGNEMEPKEEVVESTDEDATQMEEGSEKGAEEAQSGLESQNSENKAE